MSTREVPQLKETIQNLRKLLKRVNFENNIAYRELEAENLVLKDDLARLQLAYDVLDKHSGRFQQAIGYWEMMYREEEEGEVAIVRCGGVRAAGQPA